MIVPRYALCSITYYKIKNFEKNLIDLLFRKYFFNEFITTDTYTMNLTYKI